MDLTHRREYFSNTQEGYTHHRGQVRVDDTVKNGRCLRGRTIKWLPRRERNEVPHCFRPRYHPRTVPGLRTGVQRRRYKTLSYPKGLAVDGSGNVYVANSGGNEILVYNPTYVQQTGKTITKNISNPSGVAFDTAGNLWVANYGTSNGGANGSVAEYTNGVQNTANIITNGILGPSDCR